jgi:hypothetical protein
MFSSADPLYLTILNHALTRSITRDVQSTTYLMAYKF